MIRTVQRADALAGSRGNSNLQASVAQGIQSAGENGGAAGLVGIGIFGGIAMGFSAWLQGKAGAAASDALAETGQGTANYFMALGIIFQTLMLISGAIWAQDAWGRYWAWDPLETWSFITWIMLAFALHWRLTMKSSPAVGSWMILGVFVFSALFANFERFIHCKVAKSCKASGNYHKNFSSLIITIFNRNFVLYS